MRSIDADKLKEQIDYFMCYEGATIYDIIDNSPTVEPKSGEWIDTGDMEEYWGEEYECSICGAKNHWDNFCPNCGAKMEGEEE